MSAPDGDLERQTKNHRGPLRGMMAVVLFALTMLAILAFWAFGRGGDPEGAVAQVQEGTGETEEAGANDAITANDMSEEEQGVATQGAEDPTAVTVPSVQVEAPQSGMATDQEQNPIVGDSDTAEPLDPVEAEGGQSVATEGGVDN
jgi:hypothetical protein